MGFGAFVMVNLSNNEAGNSDFTSPPQCAIMLSLGAICSKSSPKWGLSHVVTRPSTVASLRVNAIFVVRAPTLSQLNSLPSRDSWAGGKKDANKSGPAETKSLGRIGRTVYHRYPRECLLLFVICF